MSDFFGEFPAGAEISIDVSDERFDQPVAQVGEHLGRLGADYFRNAAENAVVDPDTGMQYVVAGKRAIDNGLGESYILSSAPFGNGVWPHLVARAEAISERAYQAGLRGTDGDPVPVLMVASPSAKSTFGFNKEQLQTVRSGDTTPIGRAQNKLAFDLGFRVVEGNVSFSQPSAHAARQMVEAGRNFDVRGGVVIGDAPHARKSTMPGLGIRFGIEGVRFGKGVKAEGLEIINELLSSPDFAKGIWQRRDESLALVHDFMRGGLVDDLKLLGNAGILATLLHADRSLITPKKAARGAVTEANQEVLKVPFYLPARRLEITGADHSFADRVGRFSEVAGQLLVSRG